MNNISMKKLAVGTVSISALLVGCVNLANAHSPGNEGYLTDMRGNVVKNSYNECWRTGYWTPAMANVECDSDLVKKEAPRIAAPAPTPVPAPVVAAVPPPPPSPVAVMAPVLKMSTFNADAFFDYNKATLKPEGKNELDKLAEGLKDAKFDTITVIGHTDRIGSKAYNMKLSTRRAEAVKSYLVNVKGIEASKVSAIGKGKSNPMTKTCECKGKKVTRKLIACLQPDRRVDVEVSVTKEVSGAR